MKTYDVAVWGAKGYAGQELVGILENHPNIGRIAEVGRETAEDLSGIDAFFLALPHGTSGEVAKQQASPGHTVIDLSGDFRFPEAADYENWYHQRHAAPELLPVPYGLPELFRSTIPGHKLIANPGCYPTATLLGLVPLVEHGLIQPNERIVVDALSGVSGMGKAKEQEATRVISAGDSYSYKVGRVHQHVGEIEQFLHGSEIFFSPSVGPFFRGMLVKSTSQVKNGVEPDDVAAVLSDTYANEPFVTVLTPGETPSIESTKNTDGCVIGFVTVGNTVQVVSSIDNLRKGAASQAVQSFNIVFELPETSGLTPL